MEQGEVHRVTAATCTTRAASPLVILVALVLLGHAALVLADVFEAARWVPIVECVAVCVIGLVHLRRVSEEGDAAAASEPASAFDQPVVPGRVAVPSDVDDRVART